MSMLLSLGVVFFIVALVAWVLGARGLAGMSANMGMTLLWVFLVIAIVLIIVGIFRGSPAV